MSASPPVLMPAVDIPDPISAAYISPPTLAIHQPVNSGKQGAPVASPTGDSPSTSAPHVCPAITGSSSVVRIVTYNMEADINGYTTPRPGFYQVLEGIGEEQVQGNARPIDVLALQETTSNSTTVAPIVTNLNSYYNGAAVYAQSPYQATQSGSNADGNGPNALVYNTSTLTLLASVGVGTPQGSGNGEYRQVVRYEFQPVGDAGSTGIFYIYVSHMKSGTGSTNALYRGEEAMIIINNEKTLPANSSVIYTGDLNSNPPEAEFTDFTASGPGQANDPLNFPSGLQYYSDSSTSLRYRDDYELPTMNILGGTGAINYISGTLHSFGNNGSAGTNVNSGSNNSLNSDLVQDGGTFISATTLYADLTTGSDHLPVVADYAIATGTPTIGTLAANPASVTAGAPTTLTAGNVAETGGIGAITGVNFYRESNGTSGLQIGSDTLAGAGTQSGTNWTISASTMGLSAGIYTFYAVATDGNGKSSSVASTALTVTSVAPTVAISRQTPATSPTNASSVTFLVDFNENVQNVDAADFTLALGGTVTTDALSVGDGGDSDASTYTVTVPNIAGDGTVDLSFAPTQNIQDLAGNAFNPSTGITSEQTYTISHTRTWDGGGTDNNWMTAANWANDVVPVAGDRLVFTAAAATSSNNDFPAGTVFDSITFSSGGFTLTGNNVKLNPVSGVAIDNVSGQNQINLPIASDSTGITVVEAGTLRLGLNAQSIALGGGGTDIRTGKLVFDYTGGSTPAGTILSLLTASYDGGAWDRGNFRSTTAVANATTLGWKDDTVNSLVTVMDTIPGDFNLDGTVDSADYSIWFANAWTGTTWAQGDANYDGSVDGLDRDILLANLSRSVSGASPSPVVSQGDTTAANSAVGVSLAGDPKTDSQTPSSSASQTTPASMSYQAPTSDVSTTNVALQAARNTLFTGLATESGGVDGVLRDEGLDASLAMADLGLGRPDSSTTPLPQPCGSCKGTKE